MQSLKVGSKVVHCADFNSVGTVVGRRPAFAEHPDMVTVRWVDGACADYYSNNVIEVFEVEHKR